MNNFALPVSAKLFVTGVLLIFAGAYASSFDDDPRVERYAIASELLGLAFLFVSVWWFS